jgi:hypothetical protein
MYLIAVLIVYNNAKRQNIQQLKVISKAMTIIGSAFKFAKFNSNLLKKTLGTKGLTSKLIHNNTEDRLAEFFMYLFSSVFVYFCTSIIVLN